MPRLAAACAIALAAQLCLASGASATSFPASPSTLGEIDGIPSAPTVVEFPVTGLPEGPPTEVTISLTLNHTWAGDLLADLVAPDGTRTPLFAGASSFSDDSDFGGTYTFSDKAPSDPTLPEALDLLGADEVLPSERYRATNGGGAIEQITSVFDGIPSPNGTWTVEMEDNFPTADLGSVTAASLELGGSITARPDSLGAFPDSSSPGVFGVHKDIIFDVSGLPLGAPQDVSLSIEATHPFVGDVDAVLVASDNSSQTTIFSRTGATTPTAPGNGANLAGANTYRFADDAQTGTSWWAAAASAAGETYRPGAIARPRPEATPREELRRC